MGERNENERNEERQDYNIREGDIIKKRESVMREILGKSKWEFNEVLRLWEKTENMREKWECERGQ